MEALTGKDAADGDAVLFDRLILSEFTGPLYERVADRLASYGYQVLRAWIRRGEIHGLCAARRIRGLPPADGWAGWSDHDIDDLIYDTVAHALTTFRRDALAGRGWRPGGGAALNTYFAGTCLFSFATEYRKHHRVRRQQAAARAAVGRERPTAIPDIADSIAGQALVADHLATIEDLRQRLAVGLTIDGLSHAEISQILADGTTPRAVEAMIYRHRRRVQTRGNHDRTD